MPQRDVGWRAGLGQRAVWVSGQSSPGRTAVLIVCVFVDLYFPFRSDRSRVWHEGPRNTRVLL